MPGAGTTAGSLRKPKVKARNVARPGAAAVIHISTSPLIHINAGG